MGGIDMKYRIAYIREEYYSYVIQRSILWGLFWYDVDSYFDRRQAEKALEIIENSW